MAAITLNGHTRHMATVENEGTKSLLLIGRPENERTLVLNRNKKIEDAQ